MKKILILEEPESCETCPLRSYSNLALQCTPLRKTKETDDVCPLRPVPNKLPLESGSIMNTFKESTKYKHIGWNACLEELEK